VDGVLFVSESGSGKIFQINPDGSETIYMDGLDFPQALALDALGNLYAITGPSDFIPDLDVFPVPLGGDTLIQIKPNGDIHTVRSGEIMLDIAVSPQGDLFVTESNRVMRIASNWKEQDFAHGFLSATGLAFDLSGYLYVADEEMNGILRIAGFPQGIITGTVSDASGKPIENARVQALSIDPIVVGQVVFTDGNGRFVLPAAPRKYWLEVTAEGFELFISDEFAVITDGHANIEIALMTSD